jgi:hypothetical protein
VTGVALTLYTPQGLLDDVTRMSLEVVDAAGVTCDPASGQVTGSRSPDAELLEFDLEQAGCAGGALWCKTITLDRDGTEKLFQVTGFSAGNTPTVQGCAVVAVDQDPLEVPIQVLRFVEPKCCNDGVVQPNEQCDTGVAASTNCAGQSGPPQCLGVNPDFVCECDCLSKEILISRPNVAMPTDPGGVDDNGDTVADNVAPPAISNNLTTKSDVSVAFSGGSGAVANSLRAVFTDTEGEDIDIRLLTGSVYPLISPPQFMKTLRLPQCSNLLNTFHLTLSQRQPDIARLSDALMGVVFADNHYQTPNFDVTVSIQTGSGCADAAPVQINTNPAVSGGNCDFPAIAAGPNGIGLAVWSQGGAIRGRVIDASAASGTAPPGLTPAMDIEIASAAAGTRARVAGNDQHWVVVYQGTQGGIFYTELSAPGGSIGMANQQVNVVASGPQTEPDVAMLPSGDFVVVWRSGDAIMFQRYSAGGTKLNDTDQNAPLNGRSPPGATPAVAAATTDPFYVAAWATADGSVWSRLIDDTEGFRLNNVTGQNDDFHG